MIQEFDLGLLRRKVWVAVNTTKDELLPLLSFQIQDGIYGEISDDLFKDFSKSNAVTTRVYDKETGLFGYLVLLIKEFDKGSDLVDCIAHEACHVSDFVQGDLGCTSSDTEMNAHIAGYVAGKIMLTYNEEKYGTAEQKIGCGDKEPDSQPAAE